LKPINGNKKITLAKDLPQVGRRTLQKWASALTQTPDNQAAAAARITWRSQPIRACSAASARIV
jgi:hypothetical protein